MQIGPQRLGFRICETKGGLNLYYVFITESKDNQTNIDADLIAAMLNAYK